MSLLTKISWVHRSSRLCTYLIHLLLPFSISDFKAVRSPLNHSLQYRFCRDIKASRIFKIQCAIFDATSRWSTFENEDPISRPCGPSCSTSSHRFVMQVGFPVNPLTELPSSGPTGQFVVSEVDAERNISAYGGYHRASVYSSDRCSGQPILDIENFGCGGTCYGLSDGHSILLRQATTGNPKPTANLYHSGDCRGGHTSAGIWRGQLVGCTGNPSSQGWRSVYLYFNC